MDVTEMGPSNVVVLVTDTEGAVVRAAQVALSLTNALGVVSLLVIAIEGIESKEQLNDPDKERLVL